MQQQQLYFSIPALVLSLRLHLCTLLNNSSTTQQFYHDMRELPVNYGQARSSIPPQVPNLLFES